MYENQMKPAFAGMKAHLGNDNVESYPANEDLVFGTVVGLVAGGKVGKGTQTKALGVAVHDHLGAIKATDAVGVMTQGAIWCKVATGKTIAEGAVKYDANGELDGTASDTLANAVVKKVIGQLALVQLNHPDI